MEGVCRFHPQTIHGSGVNRRTIEDVKVDPDAFRKANRVIIVGKV